MGNPLIAYDPFSKIIRFLRTCAFPTARMLRMSYTDGRERTMKRQKLTPTWAVRWDGKMRVRLSDTK